MRVAMEKRPRIGFRVVKLELCVVTLGCLKQVATRGPDGIGGAVDAEVGPPAAAEVANPERTFVQWTVAIALNFIVHVATPSILRVVAGSENHAQICDGRPSVSSLQVAGRIKILFHA